MLRAFKIRIHPTEDQAHFLNGQFGAVRFVYNKALRIKEHYRKFHGINLSIIKDIRPLIAIAKKGHKYAWLADYDSQALNESFRNLEAAYKRFFANLKKGMDVSKAGKPHTHKKQYKQSSHHVGAKCKVLKGGIKLPKMKEPIKIKCFVPDEIISGEFKLNSVTLTKTCSGKYYASLLIDDGKELPEKIHHIEKAAGVDVGLKDFMIVNDGEHCKKYDNKHFIQRADRNLKRKQRKLSRMQGPVYFDADGKKHYREPSKRWLKMKNKVAKIHEHVANRRNDYQHKLSKELIDNYDAVAVEDLNVKGMLKNDKLARAVSDVGWSSFITKLIYKADWQGKHVVKIDRYFPSSKTCHVCGYKNTDLKLKDRAWICPECGTEHDRDDNAARNIREQGLIKLMASGNTVNK